MKRPTTEQLDVWHERARETFWGSWGLSLMVKFAAATFGHEDVLRFISWPLVVAWIISGIAWAVIAWLLRRRRGTALRLQRRASSEA